MLSLGSSRVMFFCCDCHFKINPAFDFFDNMVNRHNIFDKRLQCVESKLDKLSQSIGGLQDDDVMLCDTVESSGSQPDRPNGILPRPETLTVGGSLLL